MYEKLYISNDTIVIVDKAGLEQFVINEFYYETLRDFYKYYSYEDVQTIIENKPEIVIEYIEKGVN